MARWDELHQAIDTYAGEKLKTSTDADLDAFEAARGIRLPDSYREFAKTFGRCSIGATQCFMFAVPGYGDGSESLLDLSAYDAMMHDIALADQVGIGVGEPDANTDIGVRLVFFASNVGTDPFGFDPGEVTDSDTGECAIYTRWDTPSGYFRVASSLEELILGQILGDELQTWRESIATKSPGEKPRQIPFAPM